MIESNELPGCNVRVAFFWSEAVFDLHHITWFDLIANETFEKLPIANSVMFHYSHLMSFTNLTCSHCRGPTLV